MLSKQFSTAMEAGRNPTNARYSLAGIVDDLLGDADENGNLTERGEVVTETEEVED